MAGSIFWKDVLKNLVIPAGLVIIALTSLSLVGVAAFGGVRLVRLAI